MEGRSSTFFYIRFELEVSISRTLKKKHLKSISGKTGGFRTEKKRKEGDLNFLKKKKFFPKFFPFLTGIIVF